MSCPSFRPSCVATEGTKGFFPSQREGSFGEQATLRRNLPFPSEGTLSVLRSNRRNPPFGKGRDGREEGTLSVPKGRRNPFPFPFPFPTGREGKGREGKGREGKGRFLRREGRKEGRLLPLVACSLWSLAPFGKNLSKGLGCFFGGTRHGLYTLIK